MTTAVKEKKEKKREIVKAGKPFTKREHRKGVRIWTPLQKKDLASDFSSQYCMEEYKVLDILSAIPSSMKIYYVHWRSELFGTRKKLLVPEHLRQVGVIYAREQKERVEAEGAFRDIGRNEMGRVVSLVAKEYGLNPSEFKIRTLILKRGEATCVFKFQKKEIRDEKDRRVKLSVLGLIAVSRDPELRKQANAMIAELGLKKYMCKTHVVEKQIVLCSKMSE